MRYFCHDHTAFIPSLVVSSTTESNAFGGEKRNLKEQRCAVRPL